MTSHLSQLWQPPDPTDADTARRISRVENVPEAEKKLRIAVLDDVVTLLGKYGRRRDPPREYLDARMWIEAEDRGPFAFLTVCEVLGFEPSTVRRELLSDAFLDRVAGRM